MNLNKHQACWGPRRCVAPEGACIHFSCLPTVALPACKNRASQGRSTVGWPVIAPEGAQINRV